MKEALVNLLDLFRLLGVVRAGTCIAAKMASFAAMLEGAMERRRVELRIAPYFPTPMPVARKMLEVAVRT